MAQATLTLDGDVDQGPDLITKLHAHRDAVQSNNKGGTQPSYRQEGIFWFDDSGGTSWVLKVWDGADWMTWCTFNTTANTVSFSGSFAATAISVTPAGNIASTDVQAALNELDTEKAGLNLANVFLQTQQVYLADDSGNPGPNHELMRHSTTPANGDYGGRYLFKGRNSSAAVITYAYIRGRWDAVTAGAESGALEVVNRRGGIDTFVADFGAGLRVGAGAADPGAGKINAQLDVQIGGVSISPIGKQTIWVPAGAMVSRTSNGAAAGVTESSTNKVNYPTLDFDAAADEFAQFQVAMPKSWNEGTVTAQFIWQSASGTGNVVWGLQGVCISDDDALDAAFGTAQTVTDAVTAATDVMISAETSAITLGGTPAESDLAVFQVYRDADNGSDTLAADARLLGVRLFYTTNAATDA